VQQQATDDGRDETAQREAGRPHAEGDGALPTVDEHSTDQGQRRGHQRGGGQSHRQPRRDECRRRTGEGRSHRRDREEGDADEQQPPASNAVTDGTHREQ
jgi:hypothetical protein